MKKLYLALGALLITFNSIFSQDQKINFGMIAGMNYSSLLKAESEIPTDYKGKVGFLIGGFVNINLTEKLSIQPELMFSLQGGDFSIDPNRVFNNGDPNSPISLSNIEGKINESMILLPITANIHFNNKIEMQIGPQLGYSIKRKIEYDTEIVIEGDFFQLEPDSKKIELGAILDLGYNLSEKLRIGIRYAYGLIKRQNVNTSVFSLGLQYQI
ncbi:porin family protein [Aquimarina sp. W85]|uniref:porin family protein n=1 Tax=Aquimarina rhodophyticola TaxID=3342246 RepID=UPI003672182F